MSTSSHVVLSCEHVDKLDSGVSVNIDFTTICKSDNNTTGDVPDGRTAYLCRTVCLSVCVCLLACVSTYPFVHACVIWCVWCVVVKHISLQAISFAFCLLGVRIADAYGVPLAALALWWGAGLGVTPLVDRHHMETLCEHTNMHAHL